MNLVTGFTIFILIKALMSAGQFEQTTIAFGTMIGNAEETKKTLEDLTEFAALTPFEMPEIEQAARGLIMFGERGEGLMDTLRLLGDAASGMGVVGRPQAYSRATDRNGYAFSTGPCIADLKDISRAYGL